jgi:hypothetical protein
MNNRRQGDGICRIRLTNVLLILVRRMRSLIDFEPVRSPHKTKRFWMFVAVIGIASILFAQLFMMFVLGVRPFPLRVQVKSGAIAFPTLVIFSWIGFRFGRVGWYVVAIAMFAFAAFASFHS